jgi:hypothetical protein
MININDPLTSKNRIREAGAGIHKIARSDFGRRRRPQGEAQDAPSQIFSPRPVIPFPDQLFTVLSGPQLSCCGTELWKLCGRLILSPADPIQLFRQMVDSGERAAA